MPSRRYTIVDVFAEAKYEGNQLAVVRDAEGLSSEEMLSIAREFNYSETSFVSGPDARDGAYDVRIFTPGEEVPFAGHPTLGTAYVVASYQQDAPRGQVVLRVPAGLIPVTWGAAGSPESDVLWMRQLPPRFGATATPEDVATVLGLRAQDVDGTHAIQEVTTGLGFLIVPLRGLDALQRIAVNRERLLAFVREREAKAVLVFCVGGHGGEPALSVRVFTDYYGIPEDPATGSGNGCLAAYLARTRYLGEGAVAARVEQGYEIGRPSVLHLRAEETDEAISVAVGGRVIPVAEGVLL